MNNTKNFNEQIIRNAYKMAIEHGETIPYEQYKKEYIKYINEINKSNSYFEESNKQLNNIDMSKKNSAVPPPPKPGEVLICQMCGRQMLPNSDAFSKNLKLRKKQFKWQVCNKCWNNIDDYIDRVTPGLIAERQMIKRINKC